MTPLQINQKIAEALGWTSIHKTFARIPQTGMWDECLFGIPKDSHLDRDIPFYSSDLNAMHEAEKVGQSLTDGFWTAYSAGLKLSGATQITHATAKERAEAFLRTLNLWEEEKA
jgi:hypothetical protein